MYSLSEKQKSIAKIVVFFAIFSVLFLTVQAVLTPKWRFDPQKGAEGETDKYESFYALKKNSVDYLVIGNSISYRSINPMIIYNEAGITGYDLGSSMQRPDLSYYWVKEALKSQSPKVLFFEASGLINANETVKAFITQAIIPMKPSLNKTEAILSCKNETQTFLELMFPLVQFHDRWISLGEKDWIIGNSSDYHLNGAYADFTSRRDSSKNEQFSNIHAYELQGDSLTGYEMRSELQEKSVVYFEKILKLCEENNIELIPFAGLSMSWNEEKRNLVSGFLAGYGLELLDLADQEIIQLSWDTDTSDFGSHVNYWGSSKASHFLADYLKKKGFIDHKEKKEYSSWNENSKAYQIWEQEKLLGDRYTVYAYLNTLVEAKDDLLIIIAARDEASGAWHDTLEAFMQRLGLQSSFYDEIQNSFVSIVDGGINRFEKWDDHRITVNADCSVGDSKSMELLISSAGFMCGNLSSISIDGTEYTLNNVGLNIVVVDKQTGKVISSVSIDTHVFDLTFNQMELPAEQAAIWQTYAQASHLVKDGIYNIVPAENEDCVLDIPFGDTEEGLNPWLCERNGESPQEFEFKCIGDGLYTIRAVCSDQYLSVENMGNTPQTGIVQQAYTGLANQKWFVTQNQNGSYRFASLYNGLVWDVPYGAAQPGTNIWLVDENHLPPQEFFLERVGE